MLNALSVMRSYVQENSADNRHFPSFHLFEAELHSDMKEHLIQLKITRYFLKIKSIEVALTH